ncbi:hypothetical protein [Algoriphagus marinus]|uniref:hypothetical protein n=1 Tax=Algoriphagus marinus TaxID=1925762 RepID=UPI00094BC2E8|nr:hypothetical protein [Algoriphagus marinus]
MKTSTKIILSFLTFCWITLMATLLISFRYSDQRRYGILKKIEKEEILLQEFKHVVIKNSGLLTITSSDSLKLTYFKVFTDTGESPEEPELSYRMVSDTLFIDRLMQKKSGYFELKVSALNSLVLEDVSEVSFKKFSQDSLRVISSQASLVFQDSMRVSRESFSVSRDVKLGFLDYTGISSDLKANTISNLNLRLEATQAELGGDIQSISGWVGERSILMLPNKVGKVNLERSSSGIIQLN